MEFAVSEVNEVNFNYRAKLKQLFSGKSSATPPKMESEIILPYTLRFRESGCHIRLILALASF